MSYRLSRIIAKRPAYGVVNYFKLGNKIANKEISERNQLIIQLCEEIDNLVAKVQELTEKGK